jgi:predicted dehydrogenase
VTPRLRVGVIGLGVGQGHVHAYLAHPDCDVVALCDFDSAKLDAVRSRHPEAQLTESADELLDDETIDVLSIASYDNHHHEQVRRALEGGKHVFVEKPLCLREEEARELHDLNRAHPELVLSSNLILRRSPRFRLLKEWLEEGRFGTLYYLEADYDYGRLSKLTDGWRGDLDYYSVVLGGGVHVVDLLLWLSGKTVKRVSAAGNRLTTEDTRFRFDDFVVALLEFEDGSIAKVSANFGCVHPHFHGVKVFGSAATFINGLPDATLWTVGDGGPTAERVDAPYPGVENGDLIHSFVEAVAGRGRPAVDADAVFSSLAVCFAIERAAESGEPVETANLARS